jgi:hypothetical protein
MPHFPQADQIRHFSQQHAAIHSGLTQQFNPLQSGSVMILAAATLALLFYWLGRRSHKERVVDLQHKNFKLRHASAEISLHRYGPQDWGIPKRKEPGAFGPRLPRTVRLDTQGVQTANHDASSRSPSLQDRYWELSLSTNTWGCAAGARK